MELNFKPLMMRAKKISKLYSMYACVRIKNVQQIDNVEKATASQAMAKWCCKSIMNISMSIEHGINVHFTCRFHSLLSPSLLFCVENNGRKSSTKSSGARTLVCTHTHTLSGKWTEWVGVYHGFRIWFSVNIVCSIRVRHI